MEILKALNQIQKNLNVPKEQYNSFGKYKYRNCEDILSAAKSLLPDDTVLLLSDTIIFVEGRHYVKATATFSTPEGRISCTGLAREADQRKGMDASQVTGSTSSYARKYALNGLLMIDDERDSDTTNRHDKDGEQKTVSRKTVSKKTIDIADAPDNGNTVSASNVVDTADVVNTVVSGKPITENENMNLADLKRYLDSCKDRWAGLTMIQKEHFPRLSQEDRKTIMEYCKSGKADKTKQEMSEQTKPEAEEVEIPW